MNVKQPTQVKNRTKGSSKKESVKIKVEINDFKSEPIANKDLNKYMTQI